MEEPSARKSRLALAGGLAAAIAVGGAGFLVGRQTSPRVTAPSATVPATPKQVGKVEPSPTPPHDATRSRADFIALAAQAADAFASGQAPPPALTEVAGDRFELRLPFGCRGPSEEGSDAAMRWRYDETSNTLRLHVAPVAWSEDDWTRSPQPSASDGTAKGFWIARPWTNSETCPAPEDSAAPTGAEAVTLPGQTLAVAEFAGRDDAPRRRDAMLFETVLRMAPEEVEAGQGFRLRLSGRVVSAGGRSPVTCLQPGGAEQRPICVIAVTFDQAAIENPATGRTLATWDLAAPGATGG